MNTTRSARRTSPSATGAAQRRVDLQLGTSKNIRLLDDVSFIVAAVFLRENADGRLEVLLIEEASKKCRGQWFLPLGKVECEETIKAAVKREVKEEAGVQCAVEHLLAVEVGGANWYSMAYYCHVTGGAPKTVPDKESLQAQWHEIDAVKGGFLKTRGTGFFRLIDEAVRYRQWRTTVPTARFAPILNKDATQEGLFVELVVVKRNSNGHSPDVLAHISVTSEAELTTQRDPFPVVSFMHNTKKGFSDAITKLYDRLFESGQDSLEASSAVLATWCLPSAANSDWSGGLRVCVLRHLKPSANGVQIRDATRFRWMTLRNDAVVAALHLHPDCFQPALYA